MAPMGLFCSSSASNPQPQTGQGKSGGKGVLNQQPTSNLRAPFQHQILDADCRVYVPAPMLEAAPQPSCAGERKPKPHLATAPPRSSREVRNQVSITHGRFPSHTQGHRLGEDEKPWLSLV